MMTKRLYILVKAYPQPSQRYKETVCCAGITDDGKLLRLYPIPYRHLKPEQRFDRFDECEMRVWRASPEDFRPESYKVDPESIKIIRKGDSIPSEQKVKLWLPFVADSLTNLKEQNQTTERSLGIIKPDTGSVKFSWKVAKQESSDDQSLADCAFKQMSLFENQHVKPLVADYVFGYRFTSGGIPHDMKIHDWEIQATYYRYRKRYGDEALDMMNKEYGGNIPSNNLHLILGTMKAHPRQFIIIGLLRTVADIKSILAQGELF